jgi:hypothetical protein
MIQVGAVYFFVLQPSEDNDAACHARAWLFGIGTIGVLAPLIVKIRRIQKIFGSVEFNDIRAATKTAPLVKAIAIMMSIEVLFLIIYSAAGLGTADLYLVPDSSRQLNVGNGYVTYGCLSSTGSLIWVITQGAYIGGILCWLAYVGFVTRHVAEKYNESSHIAVSVYIVLVLAMIVVPLQAVVTNNPEGAIILNGVGLCFLTTSTVVAIFFPKLLYVFSVNDAKAADRAATRIDRQQTGTPSGFQSRMGGKSRADTQSRTGTKSPVADDRGISSTDGLRSPTPSAATQVGSSVNMSKYSVTTPGRVIYEEELEGQQPTEPV